MSEKWFAIWISIFFICAFGSVTYEATAKNNCRIAYAEKQWSAEEVNKVCK